MNFIYVQNVKDPARILLDFRENPPNKCFPLIDNRWWKFMDQLQFIWEKIKDWMKNIAYKERWLIQEFSSFMSSAVHSNANISILIATRGHLAFIQTTKQALWSLTLSKSLL